MCAENELGQWRCTSWQFLTGLLRSAKPNILQQDTIKKTDHTEGTLKTGVELDGVRDAECRDAGVIACGVLLAAHDKTRYSQ